MLFNKVYDNHVDMTEVYEGMIECNNPIASLSVELVGEEYE